MYFLLFVGVIFKDTNPHTVQMYNHEENPQYHPTHALQLSWGRKGTISVSDSIFNSCK